jgi:hypothetical protein
MDYKSVKIPAWAYDNAVAARKVLLRRGLDALPEEVLRPRTCPRCSAAILPAPGARGVACASRCGYRQDDGGAANVPLGVLLGLGVTALLESLGTRERGEPQEHRAERLRAAREAASELRRLLASRRARGAVHRLNQSRTR